MSTPSLSITAPLHGSVLTAPAPLHASVAGSAAGLFFKWYSSLNGSASEAQPQLNADLGPASLAGSVVALAEFGTHTLVLAATDQPGSDIDSVKAVRRSAMAGGAPPVAEAPCLVHQLAGAAIHPPGAGALTLPRLGASIAMLAPGIWLRPDPAAPGSWLPHGDYQALNAITMRLRLAPSGPPDPARTGEIPLDDLAALTAFRDDDRTWLRWTGNLPPQITPGSYMLTLTCGVAGSATSATVTRAVTVTA